MTRRTTKRQQAKELAMKALAEQLDNQKKIKTATQRAYLAQGELDLAKASFASALRDLENLGESHEWIRKSFGLSAAELRNFLVLNLDESSSDIESNDSVNMDENRFNEPISEERPVT